MPEIRELWEILVPRTKNSGEEIAVEDHQSWDEFVRDLVGGLTILRSARGVWQSPDGIIFREEMIPVRIACDKATIEEIIEYTLVYYEQEAVMAYRVSDCVIIKHDTKQGE